jgi:hypothetical protein
MGHDVMHTPSGAQRARLPLLTGQPREVVGESASLGSHLIPCLRHGSLPDHLRPGRRPATNLVLPLQKSHAGQHPPGAVVPKALAQSGSDPMPRSEGTMAGVTTDSFRDCRRPKTHFGLQQATMSRGSGCPSRRVSALAAPALGQRGPRVPQRMRVPAGSPARLRWSRTTVRSPASEPCASIPGCVQQDATRAGCSRVASRGHHQFALTMISGPTPTTEREAVDSAVGDLASICGQLSPRNINLQVNACGG